MALIEIGDCIFDEKQLHRSHGFELLDPVAREAFVNHLHLSGDDRNRVAQSIIDSWIDEMRSRWPKRMFRIYRSDEGAEITIRFHLVRPGLLNWCERDIEIITVGGTSV